MNSNLYNKQIELEQLQNTNELQSNELQSNTLQPNTHQKEVLDRINKKSTNMKISFIQPSRNNLKYLKWSYDAIRKNQGNHHRRSYRHDATHGGGSG